MALIIATLLMPSINLNAQVSVPNNTAGGGNYVGWANTVNVPLNIRQNNITNPQPINFWTNNAQRMTILGNGFVGIGTTPNNTIQVRNLINFDNATNSTFLGFLAGNSNTGIRNTFVGNRAV